MKVYSRESQCQGKFRYFDQQTAALVAAEMVKRGRVRSLRHMLQPYRCPHCTFFHLGRRRKK